VIFFLTGFMLAVGFYLLLQFRFADKVDVALMLIGTICSCLHGAALPILLLAFGDMTDSFVNSGKQNS